MKKALKHLIPRKIIVLLETISGLCALPWIMWMNRHGASSESGRVVLLSLDLVGDFVIWLSSAEQFRKLYPNKKITLLCSSSVISLARQTGYFDEAFPIDCGRLLYCANIPVMVNFRRQLVKFSCDNLIQCAYSRTIEIDYVVSCIPAYEKITIDGDCTNLNAFIKKYTDSIYNRVVKTPLITIHEIERQAAFMRGLGCSFASHPQYIPPMKTDERKIPSQKYFVVFPGASHEERQWSTDGFADVSRYIASTTGFACCVCGSAQEKRLAEVISAHISNTAEIIDMTGKTDLPELVEVIRHAALVISNDTSAVHIAVAVNTPSLCIYGLWAPGRYYPYRAENVTGRVLPLLCFKEVKCAGCECSYTRECQRYRREHHKRRCIYEISLDDVIKKVDLLISENGLKQL